MTLCWLTGIAWLSGSGGGGGGAFELTAFCKRRRTSERGSLVEMGCGRSGASC